MHSVYDPQLNTARFGSIELGSVRFHVTTSTALSFHAMPCCDTNGLTIPCLIIRSHNLVHVFLALASSAHASYETSNSEMVWCNKSGDTGANHTHRHAIHISISCQHQYIHRYICVLYLLALVVLCQTLPGMWCDDEYVSQWVSHQSVRTFIKTVLLVVSDAEWMNEWMKDQSEYQS